MPLPSLSDVARAVRNGPYVPFAVVLAVVLALAAVQATFHQSRTAVVVVEAGAAADAAPSSP